MSDKKELVVPSGKQLTTPVDKNTTRAKISQGLNPLIEEADRTIHAIRGAVRESLHESTGMVSKLVNSW